MKIDFVRNETLTIGGQPVDTLVAHQTATLSGKINANPVNTGKVARLPGRFNNNPARLTNRHMVNTAPRRFNSGMGGGGFSHRFAAGPSRSSFARSSFGGRSFGGGGGFRRR